MQTVQTQISLIKVYIVCHSTKYFKKQLYKKQNLDPKKHYENKPIQIYWKFYHQKMKIFR